MQDVVIVGAGVSGCAIARELSRFALDILVLEKEEDVCCGTSKANSGIVHAGFDAPAGSLMAKLNVAGSRAMEALSKELDVPYRRNGSLVLMTRPDQRDALEALLENGRKNGVAGLEILDRDALLAMEPHLSEEVLAGLYAPTGAIVCPFGLTIALAENAAANGVKFQFDSPVTGLSRTQAGEHLGAGRPAQAPVLEPVLEYRMHADTDDLQGAYLKLRRLEEEDPQLHLVWDHQLREIRVQLMGPVQMEILQRLIAARFGLSVHFDEGNIVYKETIAAPVEGVGHYEPLRHYAEVHLLLEPGEPGSGIVLDTMCSEDVLARNWQRLIFTHLQETVQPGVLTGSPITDLRITLVSGKAHLKHTEGGDFRQATYRAVRQGLRKAQSVLLEPWYSFRLELPSSMLGRAMTDFERMHAELSAPLLAGERAVLMGAGPVRLLRGYTAEVTSYTRGQGKISYQPAGYRPCAQQDEIVKRIGYDPERDLLHPTGSVFCSHGAGFEVKWDEVDRMAHLPLLDFSPKQEPEKPQRIVRSVAPGGAPELEKELLAIFERTYGQIKRRDVLPMMALRSQDKKELLARMEPAEEFVLVDGYNIIFAWDELKEIGRDSLDAARHVLMNLLCNYQGYRGCNLILVFDAYKVPQNLGMVEKYHNIFIVYTQEAETADSYIERVTYELRGRKRVRVATSDNLEQLIILGHGAVRVSAKSFHDEVMQTQQEIERILAQNNQKNQ